MPPNPVVARVRSPVTAGVLLGVLILIGAVLYANSGRQPQHAAAARAGDEIAVSLVEMRIVPSTITVTPGRHVVLRVTNDGTMHHDLRLANGRQTPLLAPGQSARLDAGVIEKTTDGWCTVPGHRAAGMTMTIEVGASDGAHGMPGTAGTGATSGTGPDAASADLGATPATGWQAHDASLPPAPDARVHQVTWRIKDVVREVAPGVRQTLWAFDGQVPGPVLRGRGGDTFAVTIHNDTAMTHNLDFHAEYGPPEVVMTPIPPGKSHTYRFTVPHAGAWLYHCGTEPMLQHVANGMYGALIVDPPNRGLSFHVVGAPFTTTYLDGSYLVHSGNAAQGAAQALAVPPGAGGFVELTFDRPGIYPFLTHAINDAQLGAGGVFEVS